MRWDSVLRTWLPRGSTSNYPATIAEVLETSVAVSVDDAELLFEVSTSKLQDSFTAELIVSEIRYNMPTILREEIIIPNTGYRRQITDLRHSGIGLSRLDEIEVSISLIESDHSCSIRIPPDTPDNLQPNFKTVELVYQDDSPPSLRFCRDTSIETDFPFKDYYDVALSSDNAEERVEFYLGLREGSIIVNDSRIRGNVTQRSHRKIENIRLDSPPNSPVFELLEEDEWKCHTTGGRHFPRKYHFTKVALASRPRGGGLDQELEFRDSSMFVSSKDGEVRIPDEETIRWTEIVCNAQRNQGDLAVLEGFKDPMEVLYEIRIFDEAQPSRTWRSNAVAQKLIIDGKETLCIHGHPPLSGHSILKVEITQRGYTQTRQGPPRARNLHGNTEFEVEIPACEYLILTIPNLKIAYDEIDGIWFGYRHSTIVRGHRVTNISSTDFQNQFPQNFHHIECSPKTYMKRRNKY